ncbi:MULTISPECIES: monovalent cation/H(+) antiporter subunit G [Microbulbifer]|uniref:monovalent cation/H(+) antiporter subunit G n=1 Tax=Microbulbifer TaxID=48073 RepID=UPI001E2C268A|nr:MULTISPECIES: monovalent cation/H(+) antiporter subunit G [Microbulbifer]UHQ56238.1 monovalent cation/H(+) antiporter subunit G [Microbulbifer sp. YPW16]
MWITEWLIAALILGGSFFGFTAALGLVRMPDIYMRMSTSGKAATLCCGLLLAGVAILFQDAKVTARAVAAILFLLLTVPVGAHMIARAAFRTRSPMWEDTVLEDDPRPAAPAEDG